MLPVLGSAILRLARSYGNYTSKWTLNSQWRSSNLRHFTKAFKAEQSTKSQNRSFRSTKKTKNETNGAMNQSPLWWKSIFLRLSNRNWFGKSNPSHASGSSLESDLLQYIVPHGGKPFGYIFLAMSSSSWGLLEAYTLYVLHRENRDGEANAITLTSFVPIANLLAAHDLNGTMPLAFAVVGVVAAVGLGTLFMPAATRQIQSTLGVLCARLVMLDIVYHMLDSAKLASFSNLLCFLLIPSSLCVLPLFVDRETTRQSPHHLSILETFHMVQERLYAVQQNRQLADNILVQICADTLHVVLYQPFPQDLSFITEKNRDTDLTVINPAELRKVLKGSPPPDKPSTSVGINSL